MIPSSPTSPPWTPPRTRKNVHLYIEWKSGTHKKAQTPNILFTKSEVLRLHNHSYHYSNQKLFNLIKRARLSEADYKTMKLIFEISKAFRVCWYNAPKPKLFQVSYPTGVLFNKEAALDLMWIRSKPVLHITDIHTPYSLRWPE